MPVLAAPAFLLAGALAALVPLALHLIRRRPPQRAPFPTARFLAQDPRSAVRLSRPTDLPLLAMRMSLLVLLGIGLARPGWVPAPSGAASVVLLDRSAGDWPAAVAEARASLPGADGPPRGALVLFDTAAETVGGARLSAAFFDSLLAAGPSGAPADYAAGLRALPEAARGVRGADSVRVRLVSSFGGGWTDGLGEVRRAAWPGAIELARVAGPPSAAPPAAPAPRRAVVVAREGGEYAAAALAALGYEVSRSAEGTPPDLPPEARGPGVFVVLDPPLAGDRWTELARAGATVVLRSAGPETGPGGELWFGPGLRLTGAGPAAAAPPDRDVVAVREDGRPAATARATGAGCVVEVSTHLEGGELPFQAAYPAALGRLARGCEEDRLAAPLDAGAAAVLRGRGPPAVAAAGLDPARTGTALGRWFLLAALAVALAETAVAHRGRGA